MAEGQAVAVVVERDRDRGDRVVEQPGMSFARRLQKREAARPREHGDQEQPPHRLVQARDAEGEEALRPARFGEDRREGRLSRATRVMTQLTL